MSKNVGIGNVYTYDYKLEHPETKNIGFGLYDSTKVCTVMNEYGKVKVDDNLSNIEVDKKIIEENNIAKESINSKTIRFSFDDLSYNPSTDSYVSGAHSGVWTKINTNYNNIWDYTVTGDSLENEWNAGTDTSPINGVGFMDNINNPTKVISTNFEGIENITRLFQRNWGIVSLCDMDLSTIKNPYICFSHLWYCKRFPSIIDLRGSTANNCFQAFFQYCKQLTEIPTIYLPTNVGKLNIGQSFRTCTNLKNATFDFTNVSASNMMFMNCFSLDYAKLLNTSSLVNPQGMFAKCSALKYAPDFDFTSIRRFDGVFAGRVSTGTDTRYPDVEMCLEYVPDYNMKNVSSIANMLDNNTKIKTLPNLTFTTALKNANNAFVNCYNVENNILDTYNKMNVLSATITAHSHTFTDCGSNTSAGSAQLEQIPANWK